MVHVVICLKQVNDAIQDVLWIIIIIIIIIIINICYEFHWIINVSCNFAIINVSKILIILQFIHGAAKVF